WTGLVDGLARGRPINAGAHLAKWPDSVARIVRANFDPQYRKALSELLNDPTPLLKERPRISMKSISEAGLSTVDVTILPRDIDNAVRLAADEAIAAGVIKAPVRAIVNLEGMTRRGLFDGVYPAAITTDLKNNIVPILVRHFPNST